MGKVAKSTTIQIEEATWQFLNRLKRNPSETFDDVIKRLIDAYQIVLKEAKG